MEKYSFTLKGIQGNKTESQMHTIDGISLKKHWL